ncbi:MAG: protein kinase, partial [Phycisphaerales bacterium]|nr:protein kinase [Phycisphaerales bacterium]
MQSPGTRLGVYEVVAQIGAGGMGEVYRARDTRLKRDVALKILPELFATDPDRLARFQREAEVLASLDHPHIAAIYGLEDTGAIKALVLQLVEGETLADRIARGPIPVSDALPIARQIAEALEAAHEQGVIHRDLKPANIKITPDGAVKVLDFGLAKLTNPSAGQSPGALLSNSPTITSPAMVTGVGVLLGTAAYMAPEQARGKTADRRSDMWAFGCVLYEMLTGQSAFGSEDVTMTLARVLERQPDWTALPMATPASIHRVLRRCLEKDRRRRLDSAAAARVDIEETLLPTPAESSTVASGRVTRRHKAMVAIAGALILGLGAAILLRPAERREPAKVTRLAIASSSDVAVTMRGLAISPDGTRVAYVGDDNQIYVRALDTLDATPLGGLGFPQGLFMSPDGQWLGFFDSTNHLLKKVAITGGPPVLIAPDDGTDQYGGTWAEDGTIIFSSNSRTTGLKRVSATEDKPEVLTVPNQEAGEFNHLWPEFLPGEQAVLFTILPVSGGLDNAQVALLDLRTNTRTVLLRGARHARYLSTGHLIYGAGGGLWAVGFDLARLAVVGAPIQIVERVATTAAGAFGAALAADGTLIYQSGGAVGNPQRSLVWVDRMGHEEPLGAPDRNYSYPRVSPDGTRIALRA